MNRRLRERYHLLKGKRAGSRPGRGLDSAGLSLWHTCHY